MKGREKPRQVFESERETGKWNTLRVASGVRKINDSQFLFTILSTIWYLRGGFNNPRHRNFLLRGLPPLSVRFLETDRLLWGGTPPFSVKKFPLTFRQNLVRGGPGGGDPPNGKFPCLGFLNPSLMASRTDCSRAQLRVTQENEVFKLNWFNFATS